MFVGEIAFERATNSYRFNIVDFGGFSFKSLKLETGAREDVRDKIMSVLDRKICIRNNRKLLFGSLRLRPERQELLVKAASNLNLHKFLLMNHYSFEFFTVETAFYLLKTERKFALYQLLLNAKSRADALLKKRPPRPFRPGTESELFDPVETERVLRDSVVVGVSQRESQFLTAPVDKVAVNFNPRSLEKLVNLTQKEFLDRNGLENEVQFLELLAELVEDLDEANSSATLLKTVRECSVAIDRLEKEKANFDDPARFLFITFLEEKGQEPPRSTDLPPPTQRESAVKLTSEIVVNAAVSEQQDFILRLLNGGSEPATWDELAAAGTVLWYENLVQIRTILERFWANDYKEAKDPWRILFWVILLGKPKVMSGLFKMQPDSHKFVNFFMEDFSLPASQTKAVNNAFLLRAKKRFVDSAAFFLLARKYRECLEILLTGVQNLQMVILVFRFYEAEIRADKEAFDFFHEAIQERFFDLSTGVKDDFVPAIGHLLLRDFPAVARTLANYQPGNSVIKDLQNFRQIFGFAPTAFSLSIDILRSFMARTGRYKGLMAGHGVTAVKAETDLLDMPRPVVRAEAYKNDLFAFEEEEEAEEAPAPAPAPTPEPAPAEDDAEFGAKELSRMRFLASNQKHFLALLEMISLKARRPARFTNICQEHRHYIKHDISEITFKKLSKLIKRGSYSKIEVIKKDVWELAGYFGVDPNKIFVKIMERARLLGDDTLRLALLAAARDEAEIGPFVEGLLEKTTRKCFSIIKKGQFILLDASYWLEKIFYVGDVITTLRLLSTLPAEVVGQTALGAIPWFNEILNALIKLIIIRSMCFDETLEMLEIKGDLPVMCANFSSVLDSVADKVRKMYPFTVRRVPAPPDRLTSLPADALPPGVSAGGSAEKVRVADALANDNPDNDRHVRELFLRMNQLDVTSKLNNIIADLGLADFYSPSNLCLQLLFEVLYLSGFFFGADVVKAGNIKKIDFLFESIFFESLKNFILLVSYHELEEALQLLSELQTVLESSNAALARAAFLTLNPAVALNMAFNRKFVVNEVSSRRLVRFLEDFKVFLTLQRDLESLSDAQRKARAAQFGKGIQVFRPKVDSANLFQQAVFRRVVHSSSPTSEDLYVLIQQKVRKIPLFTSLFRGKRSDEYFALSYPVS
jgi:hypothetical protein